MSEQAALLTALIMDGPVCMVCLQERTGFVSATIEVTLTRIQKVLTVTDARCQVCGTIKQVFSVQHPDSSGTTARPTAGEVAETSHSDVRPLQKWKCVICGGFIRHGDLTVFVDGDVVHEDCYLGPVDVTELVAIFLREMPTLMFCNVCIAAACRLDHAQAVKATARLRVLPEFLFLVGARCDGCDNIRITFGVRPDPTAAPRN